MLYVHLQADVLTGQTAGAARLEDVGPITRDQVRRFLGAQTAGSGCSR